MLEVPVHNINLKNKKRAAQLAILAAEQDDQKAAIRNWRRTGKCSFSDRAHRDLTKRLRELGLGDQIDAYYREVQKKLPEFSYQPSN